MKRATIIPVLSLAVGLAIPVVAGGANAPDVTDTEIKIGQTMPYSGPLSSYGTIGGAEQAYFAMVNAEGGINGRKIRLISRDDSYSPAKTVEQTRELIEQEQVAFIFQSLGDVTNAATERYLNNHHVPQLFVADGSSKWNDPHRFPWTMGWQPSYRTEAHVDAKLILNDKPDAKIGILVQDTIGGSDALSALKETLGDKAKTMIVKTLTYQPTDATIDSQVEAIQTSGANTFLDYSVPKFAAQAIRRIHNLDWHPLHVLSQVSVSISETLEPAGLDNATGLLSVGYLKDASDPLWRNDPGVIAWRNWMDKYYPKGNKRDVANVYGYLAS